MKVERNAPCPCGSGKKYKKCCLVKEQDLRKAEERLEEEHHQLVADVLRAATADIDPMIMSDAWDEFWGGEAEEPLETSMYARVFLDWAVFHHIPDAFYENPPQQGSPDTLGQWYLKTHGSAMDPFRKSLLEAGLVEPVSLHRVEKVYEGMGVLIRDLILDKETYVTTRLGAEALHPGQLVATSTLDVDGMVIFKGVFPAAIHAEGADRVLSMYRPYFEDISPEMAEKRLRTMATDLYRFMMEFNSEDYYSPDSGVEIEEDDDHMEAVMLTSTYLFDPADKDAVMDGLGQVSDLVGNEAMSDSEQQGEPNFIWVEDSDDPDDPDKVQGFVSVLPDRLETETLYDDLDGELRSLIERSLGDLVEYQNTKRENLDDIVEEMGDIDEDEFDSPDDLRKLSFLGWADEKNEDLGGLTPRQAAKQPEYREKVASLVDHLESTLSGLDGMPGDLDFLRRELGLKE
ncbi:MAG: YecA family protein [Desulfatibacillaceae bacterium]